jgi:NADH-quinone oxidoreductase subunit L
MMTNLVMGENLIMLYLGWEGVGLCSYLLIGYYYDKPAAREAAKKAFLVNRVGDFGFALGIMLSFAAFGTISYFSGTPQHTGLLEQAANFTAAGANVLTPFQQQALKWIPFLLMLGAFGKSAQFPLYVWLPDAMEGPTPVSALIHAATMVTAGVYMIARCGTLFVANDAAMWTVAAVGAFTAIFAATIALRQFDLKKVFAYSTVSQLGFMFVGVGVLAPVAGVFHLVTHAFFKALLFLASGVVMHAMAGELDMRKMSGLKTVLPKTRILMLIGCCALAGLPFFSGFFSKDEIVANAWEHSKLLGLVMLVTAFLTAYYTFRLYFRVFEGPTIVPPPPEDTGHHTSDPHAHHADVDPHLASPAHQHDHGGHHNHEPAVMIIPLVVLALGAVVAGYLNWPAEHLSEFLGKSPSLKLAYDLANRAPAHVGSNLVVNPIAFGQMEEAKVLFDQQQLDAMHHQHLYMMIISGAIAVAGVLLAYRLHLQDRTAAERVAERNRGLVRLLDHKYWVDEIYQASIVEPLRALGRAFFAVDRFVVDGIVNVFAWTPQLSGFALKITTQRGYLQGYALTMLLGIAVILIILFL